MARRIRYHPLFDCDVIGAANWYDDRSPGRGDAFTTNVRLAVEAAIVDPMRHSRTPLGLHYYRVDRFPYYVLYHVAVDQQLFVGVLHTSRSIKKWFQDRG